MTEFQGLLGVLELERVNKRIKKREIIAKQYQKLLASNTSFEPVFPEKGQNSYYKQIVRISNTLNQENLWNFCKKHDVSLTGEVYRYPLHDQPVFKNKFGHQKFPVADSFCKKHICPPVYPELKFDEVEYVCEVLEKASAEMETH